MIITMRAVRIVQVAVNQVVDMFAMGHHFMPAIRSVRMFLLMTRALVIRRATLRIGFCYINHMFINMVAVKMMQVAIVQIINMVAMQDTGVPEIGVMRMSVIFVLLQDTISHLPYSLNKIMG